MTCTCDTFKMFSFSVMQSTFRFSNVVVGTARISTLEKRNVDCMTEKLNIFKGITSTCIYSRILGRVCAVAMVTDG